MPALKKGQPVTPVDPTDPDAALEADNANPGEVAEVKARERQIQAGKYGKAKAPPYKPPEIRPAEPSKQGWVGVQVVDDEGNPVAGLKYEVQLPDGTVAGGTLGSDGTARMDGIEDGDCEIRFPGLDAGAWDAA